ncbi:MAG: hypothetical protein U0229_09825 [Anaeromyxobacter sp.]
MKPSTLALAALLVLPAAALAGDRATPEKPGGSCQVAAFVCADYDASIAPTAKDVCVKYKFSWSAKPCATKGVVGTCVKPEGAGKSYSHTYPPGSVESARKACTNTPGGVFVP